MSNSELALVLALIKDILSESVYYKDPRLLQLEQMLKKFPCG